MRLKVKVVGADPVIRLYRWGVFEFKGGVRLIFGTTADGLGRRSSAVVSGTKSKVITRSGREYRFIGSPGIAGNGAYMFGPYEKFSPVEVSYEYSGITEMEDTHGVDFDSLSNIEIMKVLKEYLENCGESDDIGSVDVIIHKLQDLFSARKSDQ